jgi:hypothetical protein
MMDPRTAEITLRVRVRFDANTWGEDLGEVAIDLSGRLFHGNDDCAEEAVEVLFTETVEQVEVTR